MDVDDVFDVEQLLQRQLQSPLPGPIVQRQMAPELAFGRHRGPAPASARKAAVLLLIHPSSEAAQLPPTSAAAWTIPAIVRPLHMKFHPGQIALPGGIVENDESPRDAALREFEEELGVSTAGLRVLGSLSPVYVFATQAFVEPFVAFSPKVPSWKPSPDEVAEIVPISLADVLNPAARFRHTIRRRGLTIRAPHFELAGHRIWGATAMILAEFAAVCSIAMTRTQPPLA
jgi:8-oxo-dGTP pyrophosphatase MutT (NUDIX family)